MKTAMVSILVLLAFAAGALLSGALAQPSMGGGMMDMMMSDEQVQQMIDSCSRMMESGGAEATSSA